MREAIYEQLPAAQRALLHGRIAEALERTGDVEASRAAFSAAAAVAREHGDAGLLTRAALGRSGLSVTVLGHDPEAVSLLAELLAARGEHAGAAALAGAAAAEAEGIGFGRAAARARAVVHAAAGRR